MALFNLGFYGSGVELPVFACWCVAIGGFTNPSVFLVATFDPDFWNKKNMEGFYGNKLYYHNNRICKCWRHICPTCATKLE